VPTGYELGGDVTGVHSLDPAFDHNPDDEFVPCEENLPEEFTLTQEQIDRLGSELENQIVRVDEEHYGDIGLADLDDQASDAVGRRAGELRRVLHLLPVPLGAGGEYFVDEPSYVHYNAVVPQGATDLRFRYSTDAAYLDTGWFIDDATVNGLAADVSSEDWIGTTGEQDNQWTFQVVSRCDLTPGSRLRGRARRRAGQLRLPVHRRQHPDDDVRHALQNVDQGSVVVSISNLPTGDLTVLDAPYEYSVVKESGKGKGRG
jgi:hypothetical protein